MNKGLNYIEDIMKSMGISSFEKLLVDGTGTTEKERTTAIDKAISKIDEIIDRIEIRKTVLV